MITMPITEQAVKHECNKILIMAQNSGFPAHIIHRLKKKVVTKKNGTTQTQVMQKMGHFYKSQSLNT